MRLGNTSAWDILKSVISIASCGTLRTITDTTFQSLPPEPVDDVKSNENEEQVSIWDGADTSTKGNLVIDDVIDIFTEVATKDADNSEATVPPSNVMLSFGSRFWIPDTMCNRVTLFHLQMAESESLKEINELQLKSTPLEPPASVCESNRSSTTSPDNMKYAPLSWGGEIPAVLDAKCRILSLGNVTDRYSVALYAFTSKTEIFRLNVPGHREPIKTSCWNALSFWLDAITNVDGLWLTPSKQSERV